MGSCLQDNPWQWLHFPFLESVRLYYSTISCAKLKFIWIVPKGLLLKNKQTLGRLLLCNTISK